MKRSKVAVIAVAILLSASLALAQEEEGLIPRLIKKFRARFKPASQEPLKAKTPAPAAKTPAPAAKTPAPAAKTSAPAVKTPAPAVKTPAPPAKIPAPIAASSAAVSPSAMPLKASAPTTAVPAPGEVKAKAPQPVTVSPTIKNMTKEELIKEINSEIQNEDEILDYIPSLKKMKDESGKEYLAYNEGGRIFKLDELDRVKLESLLTRIYNQATILQAERINTQLATIREIQNINRQAATVPRPVPSAPRTPPQPPPAPPKAPPAVPAQPRR